MKGVETYMVDTNFSMQENAKYMERYLMILLHIINR